MAFEWADRPDDAKVTMLTKEPAPDGGPCQVRGVVTFTKGGLTLKKMAVTLNSGMIRHWFDKGWITQPEDYDPKQHGDKDYATYKFGQLYAAIPEVSQAVLDAVSAQVPRQLLVELWEG